MKKYIILGILAIIAGYFFKKAIETYPEYKEYNAERVVPCIVVDKQVRPYNAASDSRTTDIQYHNVLVCRAEGEVFNINVTNNLYYSTKPGQIISFKLSNKEIHGENASDFSGWMIFGLLTCVIILGYIMLSDD